MAGIYLHIPFCKQACHYCDFHFSTNLSAKDDMVNAILKELEMRKNELSNESIESIYFGGGTPSLLNAEQISALINQIDLHFEMGLNPEITLEANPDDLSLNKLQELKKAGVNRLSIGIQTFDDVRLRAINRAHNSNEAKTCIILAREAGFENISADLIYALPPESLEYWEKDLHQMLAFDPDHISLYGLTVEEKTVLGNWSRKGKFQQVSEEMAADQYEMAIATLTAHGYEHYEVSNFGKPGKYSRHNTAYWEDKKYLGVGPGAHSYDGKNRSFNISHNTKYIKRISEGVLPLTVEQLTDQERMNDYIFTHLRTRNGLKYETFKSKFDRDFATDFDLEINQLIKADLAKQLENTFSLTSKGLMVADEISLRLFYAE